MKKENVVDAGVCATQISKRACATKIMLIKLGKLTTPYFTTINNKRRYFR